MTIDALTEDADDIRPQDDLFGHVNGDAGWRRPRSHPT